MTAELCFYIILAVGVNAWVLYAIIQMCRGAAYWQAFLPTYGNWGGIGWSSGRWNNDPASTDWDIPAIDYMDSLFKRHDYAYQRYFPDNIRELDLADIQLVHSLRYARTKTVYAWLYKWGAIIVFSVWPSIRRLLWERL